MCPKAHAAENLLAELERRGIGRDRVVIAGMCVYPEHISRVALADLALDTWPYNGHTTTSDMLWAGLPVAAVTGNSFASRVSASLLHAAGLSDLVVDSHDAYVDLVVALAVDGTVVRRSVVASRRHASAPLFDAERFARHLETAYDMMAARARAGLAPDHIDVPALPPRQGGFNPKREDITLKNDSALARNALKPRNPFLRGSPCPIPSPLKSPEALSSKAAIAALPLWSMATVGW